METPAAAALRCALLAAGWLAGTAVQLQQATLWPPAAVATLTGVALLAAALGWRARRHAAGALVLVVAAASLALCLSSVRASLRLADALPAALEGRDLIVTGSVVSLPRVDPAGARFVFEIETARLATAAPGEAGDATVPRLVSLAWIRGADEDMLLSGPAAEVRAGQRWQLPVRLRQPHGPMNPHGFDLELWLFERGIRATGTVRAAPGAAATMQALALGDDGGAPVQRARQALRDAIALRVDDTAAAGVLAALAVGDQAAIERADWDVFRDTGVAHLMSISGLHVTMFAWLAAALIGRLWRWHPALPLRWAAPQAARWGGLAAAAAYALLAGWGVPAQRTLAMLAVVAALRGGARHWPLPAVLLAAALAVALLDPWALLQPGTWLSFGAVALLVVAEPVVQGDPAPPPAGVWRGRAQALWRAVRGGLRTQLVATAGLAPLSLLFFQQVSLVGLLANLVAIPLVTLLITPLALLGALLPPLWDAGAALVRGLGTLLQAMAGWPGAVWTAAAAPAWAVAAGLLGGVLAVLPLPWRHRALALPLLLPLLAPPLPRPPAGRFELVAVDVGQGTAVLVRTAEHLLVYDAGPMSSPTHDAGTRILLPLLRARGERRIDRLVLSHRDSDHVGGAAALLGALPVGELSSSLPATHALLGFGVPHRRCDAGQSWTWDGVRFDVLHPTAAGHALAARPNALSCVLRVQGDTTTALLTGDIEAAQEAALLARDPAALRADLLLVPHHGSGTSSSPAFLAAVQPRLALVQAGYRSRYGHPAASVLARYRDAGVPVLRSDTCGAYSHAADGRGSCQRRDARRYWHHPGPALQP